MSVTNYHYRNQERGLTGRANERHGLVTSYDPKKHLAKVTFQPDGEESGWLPIEEGHMGNGWGILRGLSPGTGKGNQNQQGQGGAGGGNGGGDSGGQGGQQGGQYQGDQVTVSYHGGDLSAGRIVKSVYSKVDVPPKVESGEMLFMHSLGHRMFFQKDGSLHIYGKTSKQDDQSQSGQQQSGQDQSGSSGGPSAGGGGGGGGGQTGGSPLKNAPPLQPQTYKMKIDPKGVTTISHFQQQQGGQGGQGGGGSGGQGGGGDPADPNSTQSPPHYSKMSTDPTQLSHTHTTYQEGQGQQQQGGQSGGQGGGGQAQPATSQGDPGQDSKNQNEPKMFSQTVHDTKKGQLHHTTYDKQGKKKHQIIFDTQANKVTLQTFQQGGEQPEHQVLMDQGSGNLICQTCGGGGKQQAQIVLDKQGHITHNAQGSIKMHAQGGFQTQGKWSHSGGFDGDVVNASMSMSSPAGSVPGPTPGTAGGQAGPTGAPSFIGSGATSSTS
jgi:hypothetical protein